MCVNIASKISITSIAFFFCLSIIAGMGSQNVTKVRFQADGKATIESMLDTGINGTVDIPHMTEFTVCFFAYLLHSTKSNVVVSYFSEMDNQMFIDLDWENQKIHFHCCHVNVVFFVNVPVTLRKWHHICFATHLLNRKYWLAYDDIFLEDTLPAVTEAPLRVFGGGRLVMGQDLDTLEGGFFYQQSVHGDIADFKLFPKALDSSYLKAYVKCQDPVTDEKPLMSYGEIFSHFVIHGSVAVSKVSLKDICKPREDSLFMLPEKRNFHLADYACKRLGGSLAVPSSAAQNEMIFDGIKRFNDLCVDSYGTIYWVGVQGDFESGKWYRLTDNKELTWDNLAPGYEKVLDFKRCISIGGLDFPFEWYATNCDFLTCPLCNFTEAASFSVRGLCKDTFVDQKMSLYNYTDDKPQFVGAMYTKIFWSTESTTWIMMNRAHENLYGSMEMRPPEDYPIGLRTWNITGDKCISNPVKVLITSCNQTEYTCDDGMCITKDQRCDMTIDCPDKSDEANCNIILIPLGYSTQLPPPRTGRLPLPIRFFLGITSIRNIDILGFKMALDVVLELRWKDRRLRMKNLRENTLANKVQDPEIVWQPTLQIQDGSSSLADIFPRSKSLMVEKQSLPIPDDITRLHEDDIYLGSENTLYSHKVQTIAFTCQFQLQRYPFDTQFCSLTFSLIDVSLDFAVLIQNGAGVDFLGKRRLLEYEVTMVNITFMDSSEDTLGLKVLLKLRNLYGYYISSTYIPTTLLVIICYLTFFFDIGDFTDRVMVSLTSLLVLATLFSQTSQTIPKTAYLKLIDLWFVFIISFEFLIVLVQVIIENIRLRMISKTSDVNVFLPSSKDLRSTKSPEVISKNEVFKNPSIANYMSIAIMPVIITVFIITYVIVCSTGF